MNSESVPEGLLRRADGHPTEVALRDRRRGARRETTWAQYARRTARVGLALAELGIQPGDRVAIQARNRPEWVLADVAIQGIGAISVGIPPSVSAPEVGYLLEHCGARVLLAEDWEQVDKAQAVRDRLPALERLVMLDAGGARGSGDPAIATFAELEAAVPERHAVSDWAGHVQSLDPAAVATIAYTAGTTGLPRGVALTHANLTWAATVMRRAFGAREDDQILSTVGLWRVAERVVTVAMAVEAGSVATFGSEGASALEQDLHEVQPTILLAGPELWERMPAVPAEGALARRRLRRQLGLSRTRVALSVAAPVSSRALEALGGLGVEVRELYALTECTSVCALAPPGESRPGTVGRVFAGVEVRIVADGEILIRSPGVFAGYFSDEPATRAALDPAGWLHTGDLGMFTADGFLTVTGRKPDADPG